MVLSDNYKDASSNLTGPLLLFSFLETVKTFFWVGGGVIVILEKFNFFNLK